MMMVEVGRRSKYCGGVLSCAAYCALCAVELPGFVARMRLVWSGCN